MANSRNRFFSRLKAFILICLSCCLLLTAAVNTFIAVYREKLIGNLNKNKPLSVSINNIFYLPPNFIVLKDLSLMETQGNKKILDAPFALVSFSFKSLYEKKRFPFHSFYFREINIRDGYFLNPAKDMDTIFYFITHLPKDDFFLKIDKINFNKVGETGTNLNLKVAVNQISIWGNFKENTFSLKGTTQGEYLNIENFKLSNEYTNCQLWGRFTNQLLELKGFLLKGKTLMPRKEFKPDIFFLDIDSRIKFALPVVDIERLSFTFNNNPVLLNAVINLDTSFSCNLNLTSNFKSFSDAGDAAGIKKINLSASSKGVYPKSLKIDADFTLESLEKSARSLPLSNLTLRINGFLLDYSDKRILKFSSDEIRFSSKTTTHTYDIGLKDLTGNLYPEGELKKAVFSSKFQDGLLAGRASVKIKGFNPQVYSELRIKDVSADKLGTIVKEFEKVTGKLSARMFFFNHPELVFKGNLNINNGTLNNFEFFKWMADLFGMESLRKINFDNLRADFTADKEGPGLNYMNMDSQKIKLSGFFKLKEEDMVSAKVFFSLRKELLEKSPKFISLLRLIGETQEWIKFNFQLSGKIGSMNFRWLESEFKEDLRKAIPGFAKRGLEEKISRIIESIAAEK